MCIVTNFAGKGAVFIAHLQKTIHLIACYAHRRVVVSGIMVDLCPAVVCIFAVIAAAHGKIHRHNAAVIVDVVQLCVVAQVDTVDFRCGSLFNGLVAFCTGGSGSGAVTFHR